MNPADDLHVLLRLWREGSAVLDDLLADVVGGSVPSDPQSDPRHVRLNELQELITDTWRRLRDRGGVNGPPPRFGLPSGEDWYAPPLWMSPWTDSPASEWTLLRQLLKQGLDGEALLSRLRKQSQMVGAALERLVTDTEAARQHAAGNALGAAAPPLTDTERKVLNIIRAQPPGAGVTGKEILAALARQGIDLEQSTLTRHVIPNLKRWHGVRNAGGGRGYFIPPT